MSIHENKSGNDSSRDLNNLKNTVKEYGLFELIWLAILDIPALMQTLKFAVWIIIILALFTLAGTILPQEKFARNPIEFRNQYVAIFGINPDDGRQGFGEIIYYGLVKPLKLYRVFDTPLYLVLMCLLAISSALCAWNRLKITRKLLAKTQPETNPASVKILASNLEKKIESDVSSILEKTLRFLKRKHYSIFTASDPDGTTYIFARKNSFRHYASVAMHFAFVFIVIGGIIRLDTVMGYSGTMTLMEGESQPLANVLHARKSKNPVEIEKKSSDGKRIKLVDYYNVYRESQFGSVNPDTGFPEKYLGMPSDYVSHLQIIDADGRVVREKKIEVNHPLSFEGVTYYQYALNAKIKLIITSPGGPPRVIETTILEREPIVFYDLGAECYITQRDIVGGIWESVDGSKTLLPYAIRLVDYTKMGSPEEPVLIGYVSIDKPLSVEGTVVSLEKVEEYTILQYTHDPGILFAAFGGLILALGMTLTLYFPYRIARIIISPSGDNVTVTIGGNQEGFSEELCASIES